MANDAGVRWLVLHGIEGYPANIGRDLDVLCLSHTETEKLLDIFVACLRREGFRRIVYSPTWGRRIVGITDDYDVVELHTVQRVRYANVDFKPDWQAIEYVGDVFPVERSVGFCRGCLMPALADSKSWRHKCDCVPISTRLPWWLGPVAKQAQARVSITTASKVFLCGGFLLVHPFASTGNSLRWLRTKLLLPFRPVSPVYVLPRWLSPGEFENLVRDRLGVLFLDAVCVDTLPSLGIKIQQSRQKLIYVTDANVNGAAAIDFGPDQLSEYDLLNRMVTGFCEFNEQWKDGNNSNSV